LPGCRWPTGRIIGRLYGETDRWIEKQIEIKRESDRDRETDSSSSSRRRRI
jgi:hypothetical protein